jgi:hypothetical protein
MLPRSSSEEDRLPEVGLSNVDLIGLTLAQLGGLPPAVGPGICLRAHRYRVVSMKPPRVARSPRRRVRADHTDDLPWTLLVQRLDEPSRQRLE